jgi:predicted transposase/invertase (TIGR01784 family)
MNFPMRRDAIFYKLFQQSPSLLFDLLEIVPASAAGYRFESVTVKEPTFSIDGVFLPPESEPPGVIFFAEVQMQKVNNLYERLFAESMAHFYRNRESFSDWQAAVIYASRSTEQDETYPYRALLNSDQVHRIYLDELGAIEDLPLGVASMVLTITAESEAPEKARMLIERAKQEVTQLPEQQCIIEMISKIMIYKFDNLSREDIAAMLGTNVDDIRAFREAKEEERRSLALKMLQEGATLDFVIKVTGFSAVQIQDIRSELG